MGHGEMLQVSGLAHNLLSKRDFEFSITFEEDDRRPKRLMRSPIDFLGGATTGAESLSERRKTKHVPLDAASGMGPPPAGNLAVPIFSSETLEVEFYEPVAIDRQKPHTRDEIYVVARGRAYFWDGEQRYAIGGGSFIFVAAGQPHRFEDFSEDFAVWVFLYGPEGGTAV